MLNDPIRAYVEDLERRLVLRYSLRWRFLIEVEDHLREETAKLEADGLTPDDAARKAVASFGAPSIVARAFAKELAVRASFEAALAFVVLLLCFIGPLYGIPENVYPSAPWQMIPSSLQWKIDLSLVGFIAAGSIGVTALLVGWWNSRHPTRRHCLTLLTRGLMGAAGAALAVSAIAVVMTAVERVSLDPATPRAIAFGVVVPSALIAPLMILAFAARAGLYASLGRAKA